LRLFGHGVYWLGRARRTRSVAWVKQENPGLAPSLEAQAEAGPLIPMMRRANMGSP
jgi:hypothetical protein